jgi:hypothetical protein
MRSLRLRVICHGNKDMCLSGLRHSASISKGCALKLLQSARPFGLNHVLDFFAPSGITEDLMEILTKEEQIWYLFRSSIW